MSAQAKRPQSEPPAKDERCWPSAPGRDHTYPPQGTPGPQGQTLSQLLLVAPLLLSAGKVGLRFPAASPVSPSLLPPARWEEPGLNQRRWPLPRGFPRQGQGVKDRGKKRPWEPKDGSARPSCWNCSHITRFVWPWAERSYRLPSHQLSKSLTKQAERNGDAR